MSENNRSVISHKPGKLTALLFSLGIFAGASFVGYLFHIMGFPDTNVVVVYLLGILLIVWSTKRFLYGLFFSVATTFTFNYFFSEPRFTLSVNDPNYYITFATMLVTALITSILTSRIQREAHQAQKKESEIRAINNLTNHLTDARDAEEIADIAVRSIGDILGVSVGCLYFDESGNPENTYIFRTKKPERRELRRRTEKSEELRWRINELRTPYDETDEFYDFPLYGKDETLGIIRIAREDVDIEDRDLQELIHSMVDSVAMAVDRFRFIRQEIHSREEIVKERYRANLLRAISHDIRTPLTGIIGTSEILLGKLKDPEPIDLTRRIQSDAQWLHSMVENILNLTRIQDGDLELKKQPEALEEIIGSAIERVRGHAPQYDIDVEFPDEFLLVPMDAKLIEQVLINLMDNAIKHTPPDRQIRILVQNDSQARLQRVRVQDEGEGIAEEDLPYIFEKFYTSGSNKPYFARGVGLGLAICETIVHAHGGTIHARNRTDRSGAEFEFTLPYGGENYEPEHFDRGR